MNIDNFKQDNDIVLETIEKNFNHRADEFQPSNESSVFGRHRKTKYVEGKEKNTFFVLCNGNELYNPLGIDSHRKSDSMKLKQVNQKVFDMYMLYLKTKNGAYFTKANRRMIDG